MLEKKEKLLQKKVAQEIEKAREFTRLKNKRGEPPSPPSRPAVPAAESPGPDTAPSRAAMAAAAIQCLKKKKLYEGQIETLGNFMLRIHDQKVMLEGAQATMDTVAALKSGASAMRKIQKQANVDDVDKTMDDITESAENMNQIQQALSQPIGAAADLDDDELWAELEELEGAELDEQLLQPTTAAPAKTAAAAAAAPAIPAVPSSQVAAPAQRPSPQKAQPQRTAEDEELAALQAEMAL
eukprot:SM000035S13039  [mRNA]  locus=s35:271:1605:+ [translate_table: standard]